MKIIMTNLDTKDVCLEVEGNNLTEVVLAAVKRHTEEFGEDYLYELLTGLGEVCNLDGDMTYTRTDFSDPESNFTLVLQE